MMISMPKLFCAIYSNIMSFTLIFYNVVFMTNKNWYVYVMLLHCKRKLKNNSTKNINTKNTVLQFGFTSFIGWPVNLKTIN